MILNTAPQNEAVLSNVGEIGEFRIRNSAKAFNILSSGLYANKIRAIIRELSCNAVDSHTAAGKSDVQFEIHIPNALEPHFSIRDFGTGLSHEQVTQIYTTYFESTKTASNEFIGALGLGSKSPFSYTDNFTVTAIQGGKKGIYSAFINGEGVPSIALMMQEETDEPSGVEVKFSVNERYDFGKFREEAVNVYRHFKLKPIVTGVSNFTFDLVTYETENIIPGVNVYTSRGYKTTSVAVMGNIAYPIEVPNAEQSLGDLRTMLDCGLEIHFQIGEVDFQASREGLSYIPQTIESIKNKLIAVRDALAVRIKEDAESIDNLWERALFLNKKREHDLWYSAVNQYAIDSGLETVQPMSSRYDFLKKFKITPEELATKYNIVVRAFNRTRGNTTCSNVKHNSEYVRNADGTQGYVHTWGFYVSEHCDFVVNDTKVGAGERAKYHYRQANITTSQRTVYVLDKADSNKDMDTTQFFAELQNPPTNRIVKASTLTQKPRRESSVGRDVSILTLEKRSRGSWGGNETMVWADAGKLTSFDSTKTHYYVQLSGYNMVGKVSDAKQLQMLLKGCGIANLASINILGVRKNDLDAVRKQKNWVNLEQYIEQSLVVPSQSLILTMALSDIDMFNFLSPGYSSDPYKFHFGGIQKDSPFRKCIEKFVGFKRVSFDQKCLNMVYSLYGSKLNFDVSANVKNVVTEYEEISSRYPLLAELSRSAKVEAVSEYVTLIDNLKGI
jgi:hypothetical protein